MKLVSDGKYVNELVAGMNSHFVGLRRLEVNYHRTKYSNRWRNNLLAAGLEPC